MPQVPRKSRRTALTETQQRLEIERIRQALDQFCASLGPGGKLPRHTELMQTFAASERSILGVLDEMRRQGRVVRQHRIGTFVTDRRNETKADTAFSRTIVAVSRPDFSYYDRCLDILHRHAEVAGLDLVCRLVGEDADVEAISGSFSGARGFLVFNYALASLAKQLSSDGSRVVLIGAPPAETTPEVPCIFSDQEMSGYLAAKHLVDLGHRRLAIHVSGDYRQHRRWRGYQRAMQEVERADPQIKIDALLLNNEQFLGWVREPAQAVEAIRRADGPTALLGWNDHEAVKLMVALLQAGVRLPEEFSVIGSDALPEGEMVHPRLTTVDQAIGQQLQAAINFLARPEERASHVFTYAVVPTLIVREATTVPRPAGADAVVF